jgi:hypothetical protein
MERIMPTLEKFILPQNDKTGVLPLLPLKGGTPISTSGGLAQSASISTGKGD